MLSSSSRCAKRLGRVAYGAHVRMSSHMGVSLPETSFIPIKGMSVLPEGFAGDMNEDIEITGKESWMIRDSSRVLCSIIDAFPAKNKVSSSTEVIAPEGSSKWRNLDLDGYSNRPEWRSCVLNGQVYGTNVVETPKLKGKLKDNVSSHASIYEQDGKTAENFLSALKDRAGDNVLNKVLVTGPRGVGKSTVLTQAVMHARLSGWLCLFVPNGWDHVQSGAYVEPVRGSKGIYDNALMSSALLRDFYNAHKEQLESINVSDSTVFNKYEKYLAAFTDGWNRAQQVKGREGLNFIQMRELILEEEFPNEDNLDESILSEYNFLEAEQKSLADLLLLGIAFRDNAGSIVADIVNELKNLDTVPVLIAVDQYNSWEASSAFTYRGEHVQGFQLSVPSALQFINKKKSETDSFQMKNGMCIAAVSSKHPADGGLTIYKDIANSIPLTLHVPAYSKQEFVSVLSHYSQAKLIDVTLNRSDIATFRTVTGSVGREIRREFVSYFFPLESNNVLEEMEIGEVKYSVYGEEGLDNSQHNRILVSPDSAEGIQASI
jgi:hypothetical protein